MDFLPQQNRRVSGEAPLKVRDILATGKHVVVIGGGDTGSDCIGTSVRQGAYRSDPARNHARAAGFENKLMTWPNWPLKLRTSSSHQEGAKREFAVMTTKFNGEGGKVKSDAPACASTTR